MKKTGVLILLTAFLSSCSGGYKKIIVLTKGKSEINEDARSISVKDGAGHEATTITYSKGGSIDLKVSSQAGETTVTIPENGLYLLNTKTDTIIGSYVSYGAPELTQRKISQEELKFKIDSLMQLVEGKNISEANRNFFILPNQAVKITSNTEAIVVAPFRRMTAIDVKKGETPEVYRFFHIAEVRETITRLQALTGETPVMAD